MRRKQTGYFMEFGDDYDPRSIKNRALMHEQHRHRTIATILADLHLMALAGIFPDNCLVSTEKAYWQDFSGSESKGTEAAHCVPCQIKVTGRRPEQYLRKYSGDRADVIAAYFGKTDRFLPAVFNKCDSQAERLGLVDAFWDACIEVITSGLNGSLKLASVASNVKNAFSSYEGRAQTAYGFTVKHFENNWNYYCAFDADKTKEADTQIKIVRYYSKELNSSSAIQDITRFGEMKDLIDLYKKVARQVKK